MLKLTNIFLFAILLMVSCSQDEPQELGHVEEIPVEGSNAAIIRNPISADRPNDTTAIARITFEQPMFDFGIIKEGEKISHDYIFSNTGKSPLIINDVRTTCGCTVPQWPKQPIQPGESEKIEVKFDATERIGRQDKTITIVANTHPTESRIYLRGMIQ